MGSIFFSHNFPISAAQRRLIEVTESWISSKGYHCITVKEVNIPLGPVLPKIRSLIKSADQIIVMAFSRKGHCGNENIGTGVPENELSPWVHMEAVMAYQLGKKIHLLKEDKLPAVGIFDEAATAIPILQFSITYTDSTLQSLLNNLDLSCCKMK